MVMILTHIVEVLCWILGCNNSYPYKFLWFSSFAACKYWDSSLVRPEQCFSKTFTIHLLSYPLMLFSLSTDSQRNKIAYKRKENLSFLVYILFIRVNKSVSVIQTSKFFSNTVEQFNPFLHSSHELQVPL
jgi:hypothetical protein